MPALSVLVLEVCLQFVVCHVDSLRHPVICLGQKTLCRLYTYKSSLAHRVILDNNPQLGIIVYAGSISKQGLLSTCYLGDASLGVCAFAGEFAKNRAADDKRGAHQADRCYGFTQKGG